MTKEQLENAIKQNLTIVQMKDLFGLKSDRPIQYWIKKYGLKELHDIHKSKKFSGKEHPLCKFCGESNLENFYVRDKEKRIRKDCCKSCKNKLTVQYRINNKKRAIEYKGGICVCCGLKTNCYSVYDFHHINSKDKIKTKGKNESYNTSWSWNKIKLEIDKCELLCARCHRLKHIGISNWGQTAEKENRNSQYQLKHINKRQQMAFEHLGGKCKMCEFVGHYKLFDFHHRNPEEKEFNLNKSFKFGLNRMMAEIDKCNLLCVNCHRIIHHKDDCV